eukprot:6480426-Prymnesium_polylepis.1
MASLTDMYTCASPGCCIALGMRAKSLAGAPLRHHQLSEQAARGRWPMVAPGGGVGRYAAL